MYIVRRGVKCYNLYKHFKGEHAGEDVVKITQNLQIETTSLKAKTHDGQTDITILAKRSVMRAQIEHMLNRRTSSHCSGVIRATQGPQQQEQYCS